MRPSASSCFCFHSITTRQLGKHSPEPVIQRSIVFIGFFIHPLQIHLHVDSSGCRGFSLEAFGVKPAVLLPPVNRLGWSRVSCSLCRLAYRRRYSSLLGLLHALHFRDSLRSSEVCQVLLIRHLLHETCFPQAALNEL